jgi:hypothetical protein
MHTYIHTYRHTDIQTYIHTYIEGLSSPKGEGKWGYPAPIFKEPEGP